MSISATCPACSSNYQLADTMRGKKVRCKSCSEVFAVSGKTAAPERDDHEDGIQASPRPPKRAVRYEEDDDTDRPQPRRRPRPKRGNSALVPLLIVGGIAAVVLILGLAVVTVWALTRSGKPQPAPVASSSNPPANPGNANPAPVAPPANPGNANPPPMAPPVNPGSANPPPMVPPGQPQMPAQGPLAVQLSNGNVSGFGARMEVKVNYRFTSGNPAGKRLFLLIKATHFTGLRQNYYIAELRSIGDRAEGTIAAGGMSFGIEHGPFEMYMAEGSLGVGMIVNDRDLRKISNVVTVATKQNTMPGMRPPFGPRGRRP